MPFFGRIQIRIQPKRFLFDLIRKFATLQISIYVPKALISYNVESVPTNNTGTGHCLRFDAKAGRVAFTVGVRSPLVDITHTTASILVAAPPPPMRADRVGTGTA